VRKYKHFNTMTSNSSSLIKSLPRIRKNKINVRFLLFIVLSFVFVKSVNALPEAPIQLSQTLTDTSDFISTNITISPDGNYVIYKLFDFNTSNAADLYSAPIDGSSDPVMISDGNSKIDDFIISPDSKWVIYNSDHEELDKNELYLASIDNSSAVTKINSNFIGTGTGGIEQFVITDDSQYVIYAQTAGNSRIAVRAKQ